MPSKIVENEARRGISALNNTLVEAADALWPEDVKALKAALAVLNRIVK